MNADSILSSPAEYLVHGRCFKKRSARCSAEWLAFCEHSRSQGSLPPLPRTCPTALGYHRSSFAGDLGDVLQCVICTISFLTFVENGNVFVLRLLALSTSLTIPDPASDFLEVSFAYSGLRENLLMT